MRRSIVLILPLQLEIPGNIHKSLSWKGSHVQDFIALILVVVWCDSLIFCILPSPTKSCLTSLILRHAILNTVAETLFSIAKHCNLKIAISFWID